MPRRIKAPDPPPPRRSPRRDKYDWEAVAKAARQQRGTWVLAGTGILRAHAHQIRSGKKVAFRDENGEVPYLVATRGNGDHADLLICYVGPKVDE